MKYLTRSGHSGLFAACLSRIFHAVPERGLVPGCLEVFLEGGSAGPDQQERQAVDRTVFLQTYLFAERTWKIV